MATHDPVNYYFSGQGTVLIGERNAAGKPMGLVPVGNVSDLKIAVATQVLEHKESYTGSRGIDLRLTQETKATLSATLESFNSYNLGLSLRGDYSTQGPGTATNEALNPGIYFGKAIPLPKANLLTLSARAGSGTPLALTEYNDASPTTPWDFRVNKAAGSIFFNDGSITKADKLATTAAAGGTSMSSCTAGYPTTLTFATAPAATPGQMVMVQGITGADAALLNGKAFRVVARTATTITLDVDTTGKTVTGTTGFAQVDGGVGDVTYTYSTLSVVNALTQGEQSRWLRFEGLNTADSNASVVVDVFKFTVDPLKELALISEGIGQITLEGNVLADPLQTSGSKFFRIMQTR